MTSQTGAGKKELRKAFDFYPTPPEATIALLDFLKIPSCYKIWEPACGGKAISEVLELYGYDVISTDIQSGDDYFKTFREVDVIITNPPFNLAQEFIEKARKEADTVALLLKAQFWHAAKRKDLFYENPPAFVCPLLWRPDFLGGARGGSPTMDMQWTIWIKGNNNARYTPLSKPAQ